MYLADNKKFNLFIQLLYIYHNKYIIIFIIIMMQNIPILKICIIGDGGVGKTTFVRKYITDKFCKKYIPTIGVDIHKLSIYTDYGILQLNIWDTAGQKKNIGLKDCYYINSNAAIIMFDITSKKSYKNVSMWYNSVKNVCGTIPIVLCGNKIDSNKKKIKRLLFNKKHKNIKYIEISSKDNVNIEEPFLYIIKKLSGIENIEFNSIDCENININNNHNYETILI